MNTIRRAMLALLIPLFACTTVPAPPKDDAYDGQEALPASSRTKLDQAVRQAFSEKSDAEIETYVQKTFTRIFPETVDSSRIRVRILAPLRSDVPERLWVVPPDRLEFDDRLLRKFRFENELAAAVAFEWLRIQESDFLSRLSEETAKEKPDLLRIYRFTGDENRKSALRAVDQLYRGGYDPRGLVAFIDYQWNALDPEKEELKAAVRKKIAEYSPLLHPIVKTQDFYRFRSRLEHL